MPAKGEIGDGQRFFMIGVASLIPYIYIYLSLSCFIMFYHVLSCFIMFYHVLSLSIWKVHNVTMFPWCIPHFHHFSSMVIQLPPHPWWTSQGSTRTLQGSPGWGNRARRCTRPGAHGSPSNPWGHPQVIYILRGFSINHQFWGATTLGNHHMEVSHLYQHTSKLRLS